MKPDSLYMQQVLSDPDYQYWREVDEAHNADTGTSIGDNIDNIDIDRMLNSPVITFIAYIMMGLVFAGLIWRLIRGITVAPDREDEPRGMGDDTIYGHTWESEINDKYAMGQYSEVVVLCYLRWLEQLNDMEAIKFSAAKTPGIFTAELTKYCDKMRSSLPIGDTLWTAQDLKAKMHALTDSYLRIRYGHKTASEQLAKQMMTL